MFFFQESRHNLSDLAFLRNGSVNTEYMPVKRGIYHLFYSRLLKYFDSKQILVLDGDIFIKDPYTICKQVETFLGLPPFITRQHFVFNEKKNFFCKVVNGKTICMDEKKGRKHKNVSFEDIVKLKEFYKPHNRIIQRMLNYTFSWS